MMHNRCKMRTWNERSSAFSFYAFFMKRLERSRWERKDSEAEGGMKRFKWLVTLEVIIMGGFIWWIMGTARTNAEFVKLADKLDYCGGYFWDPDARILYTYYRDSSISGMETAYQWEDEMNYKKIRRFEHDDVGDGVQIKIVRYDEEKEEVICDYVYSMEEYDRRMEEIWGIYYKDFIWEQEVTDRSTGKKYMLRYAEEFKKEMAEYNKGIYYDGKLYVFDEDTYLVWVWQSEIVDPCSGATWKEDEQELVIHYGEGSSVLSAEWLFDDAD